MTSRTGSVGWDLRKSSELSFSARRRRLTFGARRDQTSSLRLGVARGGGVGCRWKSQHRKIVFHSPYVEKPFNSKVIKSFVPELRSRQVFFVFRDSYVIYICASWTLWTFCVPVWICLFHIFISGDVTFIAIALEFTLVVASDWVLSMGLTKRNCVLMLSTIVWNRTVFTVNCVKTQRVGIPVA